MEFTRLKYRWYAGISRRGSPCRLLPIDEYNRSLRREHGDLVGLLFPRFVILAEENTDEESCLWFADQLESYLDEILDQLGVKLIELFPAIKRNVADQLPRFLTDERIKLCAVLNIDEEGARLSGEADWCSLRVSSELAILHSQTGGQLIKQQVAMLVLNRLAGWLGGYSSALSDQQVNYSEARRAYQDKRQLPTWFVRGVAAWISGMPAEGSIEATRAVAEEHSLEMNNNSHSVEDYRVYVRVIEWLCTPCSAGGAGNTPQDLANMFSACKSSNSLFVLESLLGEGVEIFSFRGLPERFIAAMNSK